MVMGGGGGGALETPVCMSVWDGVECGTVACGVSAGDVDSDVTSVTLSTMKEMWTSGYCWCRWHSQHVQLVGGLRK